MNDGPFCSNDVLEAELDEIHRLRTLRTLSSAEGAAWDAGDPRMSERDPGQPKPKATEQARQKQLVGLAFSGGGIRSATFNLGVLQGLARLRLLHRFDYLSTVSGGGYIGCWLSAWLGRDKHEAGIKLEKLQGDLDPGDRTDQIPPGGTEPPELRHLREYSSYLTPRRGFSVDTAHAAALVLRNLLLTLVVPLLVLASAMLFAHGISNLYYRIESAHYALLFGALALFQCAILVIASNLSTVFRPPSGKRRRSQPRFVYALGVVPFLFACWLTAGLLWWLRGRSIGWSFGDSDHWPLINVLATFLGYFLMWGVAWWIGRRDRRGLLTRDLEPLARLFAGCWNRIEGILARLRAGEPPKNRLGRWLWQEILLTLEEMAGARKNDQAKNGGDGDGGKGPGRLERGNNRLVLVGAFFATWVGGGLLFAIGWWMASWPEVSGAGIHPALLFGGPLVAVAFASAVGAHVGFAGSGFIDADREWTSRFTGTLLLCTLTVFVVFLLADQGPGVADRIGEANILGKEGKDNKVDVLLKTIFGAGWIGTIAVGVRWAMSEFAPEGKGRRWVVLAAPPLFAVGTFVGIAWIVHVLELTAVPWIGFFALLVPALVLSIPIGVNRFSLHSIYRNRLVRCYLGASTRKRERARNPWTDLAAEDDELRVSDLQAEKGYRGPYPLICTTLNLVATKRLAWQKRKAASFVFAPLYSGFEVELTGDALEKGTRVDTKGFRPSAKYANQMRLGAAMAISGAAVSPNMGHHSSRAVSLLLSLLNVRLGWWIGNPRHNYKWKSGGPWFGLRYLLFEMLGMTTQYRSHVYLSDGGHFDNLGLYELVRRRCRYVLVCDAEQDQSLSFTGLATAIERCRVDFGVDIRIDVDALRRSAEAATTPWHCAVGRIEYLLDEKRPTGILVYLKASLTGNEPIDVQQYASKHPEFPHQSTGDQWFDETQFESYRVLGYHALRSLFDFLEHTKDMKGRDRDYPNERLFVRLSERWHTPSATADAAFARHGEALSRIVELIRSTWDLRFLEDQLYPEWRNLRKADGAPEPPQLGLPDRYAERRAGFHACCEMIQLMENVYHDFALETQYEHPDNRGWMNLFRHWSWSSMFRVTWAITAGIFGARFQEFCRAHLELDVTESVRVKKGGRDGCSFVEEKILKKILKNTQGDVLWVIEVAVPDPRGEQAELLEFPVGMAVVRGHTLRFFRIQDHVRKMGLARAALIALLEKDGALTASDWQFDAWPEGLDKPSETNERDFKRVFASAQAEVSSRPNEAPATGQPGARP